mmetsp:Transcript_20287/g.40509  ORF Transcript_20287/g.40509 Transcript_20287/m.40509 type:complete len:130 (-) Transcript_20287:170-559(-)
MGSVFSSPGSGSIGRYKNDFELACRTTKLFAEILERDFGAPDRPTDPGSGLHDKITAARIPSSGGPLPPELIRRMRYVTTVRNRIVHEVGCDALPDRTKFVGDCDGILAELEHLAARKKRGGAGGCAVM